MAHVAESKKKIVKEIVNLINQYPIIGAVNMENLPAPQLQKMRAHLRDKIEFAMTKKRLMKIALEKTKDSKKGIEKLEENFTGMPALIFTKENPFSLFKILKKNKSPAPAKAGQIAPKDIIVPAGPTTFAPGPIIGELAQIGIKSGVEGGKVAVKQDSVVAKRGDKIKPKVAEILTRLGIEPMEVGLDLVAAYEDGTIYTKYILDIDEDRFMADLKSAAISAFNVAMFVAYPTKDTINFLISKAFNDSKALGLSQDIIDEGIIDDLLAKAQRQMLGLSGVANIEVKEERKPEVKEEKLAEKSKKEPKKGEKKPVHVPKVENKKAEEKELEAKKKLDEEKRRSEEEKKKYEEQKRKEEEARKKQEVAKKAEEEQKRIEEAKKVEELKRRAEEEKKKQEELKKKEEVDIRVKEMVEKTKKIMTEGAGPSAADILEDVKREQLKKVKQEEIEKKDIEKEHPKAQRLVEELQKKGTLRGIGTEDFAKKKPVVKDESKEDEQKKVEELFDQLKKKGTLRTSEQKDAPTLSELSKRKKKKL